MHRLLIPALAIVASCYRPHADGACVVRCDPLAAADPGACPAGLHCGTDGLCFDDVQCDTPGLDGGVDGATDTNATECYQTALADMVCPIALRPSFAVGPLIDTDNDCDEALYRGEGGAPLCLIATTTLAVAGDVQIVGSRPLVLYVKSALIIPATATLDVSVGGAGANGSCDPPGNGGSNGSSQGGGAGGSFVGTGGAGGANAGGVAVAAPTGALPTRVRGGCNGGAGGLGANATGGGGGAGGGALQLISPTRIDVLGAITAGGGGGSGASGTVSSSGGGGGGGSGGLVALDSPLVTFASGTLILAHGGSGGGGVQGSATSSNGAPGARTDGTSATRGLGAGTGSGSGGLGSSDSMPFGVGGESATGSGGAGGGGGGVGAILVHAQVQALEGNIHPLPRIAAP